MRATIWGTATQIGALVANRSLSGAVTAAHSYDNLETELPPDGLTIDLDHNGERAGEILYAEVGADDRCRVVAVLDDGDWLAEVPEPIFFSPTMEMVGDVVPATPDVCIARTASLLGVSLTLTPATVAAEPICWRSGDLHRPSERTGWPVTWRQTDLLARAAAQLDSRDSRAERIIDCRATAPGAAAECETASPRQPVQPGGLWLRSAGVPLDVAKHRREIECIVMPYGVAAEVPHPVQIGRIATEVITRGAFAGIETRAGRIRANREHQEPLTFGRAVAFNSNHDAGLHAVIRAGVDAAGRRDAGAGRRRLPRRERRIPGQAGRAALAGP